MPLALALPSTAQLERANGLLGEEIRHRHRAEAALREAHAELERRVAARTADLQDEVVRRRDTEATLRASGNIAFPQGSPGACRSAHHRSSFAWPRGLPHG
jgi:hypothetical protein